VSAAASALRAPATANETAAPRRLLRLGMPHLDARGLSEGWLFRDAGDLHWEAISRRLGVATDEIRDEARGRLYPTVVALRARYEAPLSVVRENDRFEASVELVPCGGACAHGRVAAAAGAARLSVELLTTFAARQADGALRMALPAARLASRWTPPETGISPSDAAAREPALARLARAARRREPLDDAFAGPTVEPAGAPLGSLPHLPSPYADYNGAGLLYFAAYPTIADTAERRLVMRLGLGGRATGAPDWALATSPVRRDVFYYGNLLLGEALFVELLAFELDEVGLGARRARPGVKTRVRLRRARDGQPIADVITRRLFVDADGRAAPSAGRPSP
jgi:probable biosynthetic protein (TIGR04098 family)